VVRDPGLHRDDAHRVRDDVVELTGDPQPFLGDRPTALGSLLQGLLPLPLAKAGGVHPLLASRIADGPRRRYQQDHLRDHRDPVGAWAPVRVRDGDPGHHDRPGEQPQRLVARPKHGDHVHHESDGDPWCWECGDPYGQNSDDHD
jgi:hypothetical protein